jgi:GT2 family glycosyltransferase
VDISIVIVNFRSWKALDACLGSLSRIWDSKVTCEIIVVDNCSGDANLAAFTDKYSQVTFMENTGNNGFSNGCNVGAKAAKGEFLLFLNPDTIASAEAVATLLETGRSHPEIAILSCLQIDEHGSFYNQAKLFPSLGRFFGITRFISGRLHKKELQQRFDNGESIFYPDWVTGAVFFMSRDWFARTGGWNEDYWLYYEDVDLCRRAFLAGGKVAVTRNATIGHKHGGASRIDKKTKALAKAEVVISKHTYISNNFSFLEGAILHTCLISGTILEKTVMSILGLIFFFIPRLNVNLLILKNLVGYYARALYNRTWISPRSMNYLSE